jgi:hypothetical protein
MLTERNLVKVDENNAAQFDVSLKLYFAGLINSKAVSTVTGPEWPRGFQEVKVPRFHDNGTGWW